MSLMEQLRREYPRTVSTQHSAWCEKIPMSVFNANEARLREEMRMRGYRAIYRGPRKNAFQSMTRRSDATHVLLYRA